MPLPTERSKRLAKHSTTARLQHGLAGFMLTLSCLITAFWISWHGLAQLNFGYTLGYDVLEIQEHIQRFGPSNQYRHGFEHTDKPQHVALFAEIVRAIQHDGVGLEDIRYHHSKNASATLLREPEVVHLQDVAHLITLFNWVAMTSVVLLIVLLVIYRRRNWSLPTGKQIALGTIITITLVGVCLLLVGPTATFYWLHTKVFPENHQWFFYYQESLMTTLMKAPDLFGFIAVLWITLALLLFGLGQWLLHKAFRH